MKHQSITTTKHKCALPACLLVLFFLLSQPFDARSQEAGSLSREQKADSSLTTAIKTYDLSIGRNSFLFTGRVYFDKYNSVKEHQFFVDDYWELGEVDYAGQHFDSIYLMYEIYSDLLLVEHFNSQGSLSPIELHSESISSFSLFGHKFVRLEPDTLENVKEGFYDVLFDGEQTRLYAFRRKEIVKANEGNSVVETFVQKDKYYLHKDGHYYRVRKKRSLLKVLEDHKKELKRFIKSNALFFSQNSENALVEVVQYYDSLP
jgi:hypothetical protein